MILFCTLLIFTSCGRIRTDDFSAHSVATDFGNFSINLQPHRSGIFFIHYGPPYDLLLSYNFNEKVRAAKILSLRMKKENELKESKAYKDIKLSIIPNPGESRIYYRISDVLTEYKEVLLRIEIEILSGDGNRTSYTYIKYFEKQSSSRSWSFFELV